VAGIRQGKWTQRILTAGIILGLLIISAAGLFVAGRKLQISGKCFPGKAALGTAMIFVLLTYGGWMRPHFSRRKCAPVDATWSRFFFSVSDSHHNLSPDQSGAGEKPGINRHAGSQRWWLICRVRCSVAGARTWSVCWYYSPRSARWTESSSPAPYKLRAGKWLLSSGFSGTLAGRAPHTVNALLLQGESRSCWS